MANKKSTPIYEQHRAGKIIAACFDYIQQHIKAGNKPIELDKALNEFITSLGGISCLIGMYGFPNTACISVNDCLAHGIPSDIPLKELDVVKIDLSVSLKVDKKEYFADAARTYIVPINLQTKSKVQKYIERIKLKEMAEKALSAGAAQVWAGNTIRHITEAMNAALTPEYTMVAGLGGHGIGLKLHQRPYISNTLCPVLVGETVSEFILDQEYKLKIGDVICIEPIIVHNPNKIHISKASQIIELPGIEHGYYSAEKLIGAHAENTHFVTKSGYIVLTELSNQSKTVMAANRLHQSGVII